MAVRAQDVLTNSLTFYQTAMIVHMAPGNSVKEPPRLYKAMETFRVTFPSVWRSLNAAVPAYEGARQGIEQKQLDDALKAVETMVRELRDIWGGGV